MSWVSHFERSYDNTYREWILKTIQDFLEQFEAKFLAFWDQYPASPLVAKGFLNKEAFVNYQKEFMKNILRDAVGFAGCKIARRQLGIAGVADIRDIKDDAAATRAETMAIAIARKFVVERQKFNKPNDIIQVLREFQVQYYPAKFSTFTFMPSVKFLTGAVVLAIGACGLLAWAKSKQKGEAIPVLTLK